MTAIAIHVTRLSTKISSVHAGSASCFVECWQNQAALHISMDLLTAGGNSILQDYPWGKYERHVDIAGAYGSFVADLLTANPKSTGVLFDQPQVRIT